MLHQVDTNIVRTVILCRTNSKFVTFKEPQKSNLYNQTLPLTVLRGSSTSCDVWVQPCEAENQKGCPELAQHIDGDVGCIWIQECCASVEKLAKKFVLCQNISQQSHQSLFPRQNSFSGDWQYNFGRQSFKLLEQRPVNVCVIYGTKTKFLITAWSSSWKLTLLLSKGQH